MVCRIRVGRKSNNGEQERRPTVKKKKKRNGEKHGDCDGVLRQVIGVGVCLFVMEWQAFFSSKTTTSDETYSFFQGDSLRMRFCSASLKW